MKHVFHWSGLLTAAFCLCLEAPGIAATPSALKQTSDAASIPSSWVAQADDTSYMQWGNQCSSLIDSGKFEAAIAACDRALESKPDYSVAWTNRCVALGQIDRYQEAVDSCRRALTGDGMWGNGSEAGAWINFGGALLLFAAEKQTQAEALPLLQQALLAFDKSLEIQPNNNSTQQLRNELAQLIQELR